MFCYKCGASIPEGSKFCTKCGTKILGDNTDLNQTKRVMRTNSVTGTDTDKKSKGKLSSSHTLIIIIFVLIIGIVGTGGFLLANHFSKSKSQIDEYYNKSKHEDEDSDVEENEDEDRKINKDRLDEGSDSNVNSDDTDLESDNGDRHLESDNGDRHLESFQESDDEALITKEENAKNDKAGLSDETFNIENTSFEDGLYSSNSSKEDAKDKSKKQFTNDEIREAIDFYARYVDSNLPGYLVDLIYIDDDNIPELLIHGTCEADGNLLVAYFDGEFSELQTSRLSLEYIEKEGLILNSDGHMGYYYDILYVLENHSFKNLASGYIEEETALDNGEYEYSYTWNNQKVSEEIYNAEIAKAFLRDKAISSYTMDGYSSVAEAARHLSY